MPKTGKRRGNRHNKSSQSKVSEDTATHKPESQPSGHTPPTTTNIEQNTTSGSKEYTNSTSNTTLSSRESTTAARTDYKLQPVSENTFLLVRSPNHRHSTKPEYSISDPLDSEIDLSRIVMPELLDHNNIPSPVQQIAPEVTTPREPCGNFNPPLTSSRMENIMEFNLTDIMSQGEFQEEAPIHTDWPSTSLTAIQDELMQKGQQLTQFATTCIQANHHLRIVNEAQTKNAPPKGLTPTLRLTAMGQTTTFTTEVEKILRECGLTICKMLSNHYVAIIKENKQGGKNTLSEMEAMANKHPDPTTKKNLLETVANLSKEAKEKAIELSTELKGKANRKRARTETDEDQQLTRKSHRVEENDLLTKIIERLNQVTPKITINLQNHNAPPRPTQLDQRTSSWNRTRGRGRSRSRGRGRGRP